MPRYEIREAQTQYWVHIGISDGCGMGRMETVKERHPFPTRAAAEKWLDEEGWLLDEWLLRRTKAGNPFGDYGIVSIKEVLEFDKAKWISEAPAMTRPGEVIHET